MTGPASSVFCFCGTFLPPLAPLQYLSSPSNVTARRFKSLLTKDELAGLACCPDVEARVITGGRYVLNAGKDWEVEHGPFEEQVRLTPNA